MAEARLFVSWIDLQKDKYGARSPDVELDKDLLLDTEGFLAAERDQLTVEHFKRFVVAGEVECLGRKGTFTLTISLRGNIVTISARPECPVTSYGVYWMLERHVENWNHRRYMGGADQEPQRGLLHVDPPTAKAVRATTRDGFWLADVLHHLKDDKKGVLFTDFPQDFVRIPQTNP